MSEAHSQDDAPDMLSLLVRLARALEEVNTLTRAWTAQQATWREESERLNAERACADAERVTRMIAIQEQNAVRDEAYRTEALSVQAAPYARIEAEATTAYEVMRAEWQRIVPQTLADVLPFPVERGQKA